MNRILFSLLSVAVACTALGQTPVAPKPARANITENGKVTRFLAGPSDRPEGFLLRDGTFVIVPPGLSQQLPPSISTGASISVTGDEFTYAGSRTIHAQRVVVAGVSYNDIAPDVPAPPPPPASAGAPRPPLSPAPPPPPASAGAPRSLLAPPPPTSAGAPRSLLAPPPPTSAGAPRPPLAPVPPPPCASGAPAPAPPVR